MPPETVAFFFDINLPVFQYKNKKNRSNKLLITNSVNKGISRIHLFEIESLCCFFNFCPFFFFCHFCTHVSKNNYND